MALADTAESLYNTANSYEEQKQFDSAVNRYQQVLAASPNDPLGQRAKIDIDKINIIKLFECGNITQAQIELDKFTTAYSSNWYFPPALYRIAERCEEAGQLGKAKSLYQQIQLQYPQDPYANRAQVDVSKTAIITLIDSGNAAGTQNALDKLMSDFGSNAYLPIALYRIAERLEEAKWLDKAKAIYTQVAQQYANNPFAERANIDVLKTTTISAIESDDDSLVQSSLNKLKSDFSQNPYLPSALYRIAERFEESGWPDKARAIYSSIAQQYPSNVYAERAKIDASKATVLLGIQSNNENQVLSNLSTLNNSFSSSPYLPTALYRIAEQYEETLKFNKAKTVYSQIVQQYPNDQFAAKSKIDLVKLDAICLIDSATDTDIQTIIGKLKTDFKDNPYVPAALFRIAERLEDAKKYDFAKTAYLQITKEFPNSSFVGKAQLNIAKINIIKSIMPSSYAASQAAIDKLATDYNRETYPTVSNALYLIAEKCYVEGQKADANHVPDQKLIALSAEILQKYVLGKISGKGNKASAYYMMAIDNYDLGNSAKTIEYANTMLQLNDNHQYAFIMPHLIGNSYEKMKNDGQISASQADTQIENAYKNLLTKFPQSNLAGYAAIKLSDISINKGNYTAALNYCNTFLSGKRN